VPFGRYRLELLAMQMLLHPEALRYEKLHKDVDPTEATPR
jgi:hypothetical protein